MHNINLETHSDRCIPRASNLQRESHVLEDEVNVRRDFTHRNGFQHGSASRDHIHFDENMIVVHKEFQAKIDSLLVV